MLDTLSYFRSSIWIAQYLAFWHIHEAFCGLKFLSLSIQMAQYLAIFPHFMYLTTYHFNCIYSSLSILRLVKALPRRSHFPNSFGKLLCYPICCPILFLSTIKPAGLCLIVLSAKSFYSSYITLSSHSLTSKVPCQSSQNWKLTPKQKTRKK